MNRFNRYRVEISNDFREIRDDVRGFGNRYRNEYNNFRQNWRQQIPIDYRNMQRGHAQAFNQGRAHLARGYGQGRDFLGRNIFGDDYNRLPCVQNRNRPRGDHVIDRNGGNQWVPMRGRGPYMSGALHPYRSRVYTL